MYLKEYEKKLITPPEAAGLLKEGDALMHGLTMAEPPAMLAAIADRLKAGDLKKLKTYALLPLAPSCRTILARSWPTAWRRTAFSWAAGSAAWCAWAWTITSPTIFIRYPD